MKKIFFLLLSLSLILFSHIAFSRTCSNTFGIGSANGTNYANGYSLSGFPLPFHMIARSGVYNVAIQRNGGYEIETTRTRMDMYFTISQRNLSGASFNILSVKTVQE